MPFVTIPNADVQYALLSYDKDGRERTGERDAPGGLLSKEIEARVARDKPSHVFLFSHGWKGDVPTARDQYDRWIGAMVQRTDDRAAMGSGFKPLWIGLHWPSQPFGDEEIGGKDFDVAGGVQSPDEVVATYLDRLDLGVDAEPLLRRIVNAHQKDAAARDLPTDAAEAYRALAKLAGYTAEGPSGPPDADGAPFDPGVAFEVGNSIAGSDFGGGSGVVGGILSPLRQLSYWTMKKRARSIGEGGMHDFVERLMNASPTSRVHLMGHSFGCIIMSSLVGGRGANQPLPRAVDSLALIQGAVSLWAFGDEVHDSEKKGYFNPWVRRSAVRGPVIVSRSIYDKAVGTLYPWASMVSLSDAAFDADDDEPPKIGAIGRFGVRGIKDANFQSMLDAAGNYSFAPGRIYNLESSKFIRKGSGVSGAHSDIDGPEVAHALWQAARV